MRIPACTAWAVLAWAVLGAMGEASAQQPSQAQANAIRQNCRGDYPTYCSGVPTGGAAALQCLQQNAAAVSPACRQSLAAVSGGGGGQNGAQNGAQNGGRPPATASAPPRPPMTPRQEMAMLRSQCGRDYRAYCRGVEFGGGRALGCLKEHGSQLSPSCQSALLSMRQGS